LEYWQNVFKAIILNKLYFLIYSIMGLRKWPTVDDEEKGRLFMSEVREAVKTGEALIASAEIPHSAKEILQRGLSDAVSKIMWPWATRDTVALAKYQELVRQKWIERTANDPTLKKEEPKEWDGTEWKEGLPMYESTR
jgi:hypothetical protein